MINNSSSSINIKANHAVGNGKSEFIEKNIYAIKGINNRSGDLSTIHKSSLASSIDKSYNLDLETHEEIDYIHQMLLALSQGECDVSSIKYEIEELIERDNNLALATLTQIATDVIMPSKDEELIENFLFVISSLSPQKAKKCYRILFTSFLAVNSYAASKGSLIIFDKFGDGETDFNLLSVIRDLNVPGLDDYKNKILERLKGTF